MRADGVHLFPALCSVSPVGSLKSAIVGVFKLQKSAKVTHSILPSQELVVHLQHPAGYKSHKQKLFEVINNF